MKRYLILELDLSKDIPELADKIAGRAWTLDGVEEARVLENSDVRTNSRAPSLDRNDGPGVRKVGAGVVLRQAHQAV